MAILEALQRLGDRPFVRYPALALLIGTAIVLLWRSETPRDTNLANEALRGPSEPDGFVVDAHYTSYDANGNLKIRFNSPRIEQFESNSLTTIESPEARYYTDPAAEPWHVTADRGRLLQDRDRLHLIGHVLAVRDSTAGVSKLATTRLTLDNAKHILYTDAPVTLTDPTGVTDAVGMKAWLDDRILELNAQVEGRYETAR
ncbi:LPS export ABC transporter periplasmic protein LptC [Marinobacter sp. C2H3]|uniref:LPS export ABC transporter periplasmic protein LptC n=1 Tax=Marinobacter sp. C2H3 TaxID=3119003 RepID=UPI00300F2B9E